MKDGKFKKTIANWRQANREITPWSLCWYNSKQGKASQGI
jgi:hypothetical protein